MTVPPSLPSAEYLQTTILKSLDTNGEIPDSREIEWNGVKLRGAEEQNAIRGTLDSLASREVSSIHFTMTAHGAQSHLEICRIPADARPVQMVSYSQITTTTYETTAEGSGIAASGSHEYRVWAALPVKGQAEPVGLPELKVSAAEPPAPFRRTTLSEKGVC